MAFKSKRHRISDYKFSEYRHSKEGIAGLILGLVSFVLFIICIRMSYNNQGAASIYIGGVAIDAMVVDIVAIVFSVRGYRDEDVYKFFPKLGLFTSIITIILWIAVIVLGAI